MGRPAGVLDFQYQADIDDLHSELKKLQKEGKINKQETPTTLSFINKLGLRATKGEKDE